MFRRNFESVGMNIMLVKIYVYIASTALKKEKQYCDIPALLKRRIYSAKMEDSLKQKNKQFSKL